MALCVCHSGVPDENCIELALQFINNEEAINAPSAIEQISKVMEQIEGDFKKSPAFLKLRQSKLIAECGKLVTHEAEQIAIMIDAIQETVDPDDREKIITVGNRIKAAIS